jgi:hypothetical protein
MNPLCPVAEPDTQRVTLSVTLTCLPFLGNLGSKVTRICNVPSKMGHSGLNYR